MYMCVSHLDRRQLKWEKAARQNGRKQVNAVMSVRNRADQISVIYRDGNKPAVPTDWAVS